MKSDLSNNRKKIPYIIHQVYEDMNGPSDALLEISNSWKTFHPEWKYMFWNKESIEDLLYSKFRNFFPIYRNYPFNVQRWDAIRYLILFSYGGLYVDMDYECLAPFDLILHDSECCMGLEPYAHALEYKKSFIVGNALMATVPANSFFELIIEDMVKNQNTVFSKFKKQQIIESTGPFLTTRVYNVYPNKVLIKLLTDDLVAPLSLQEVRALVDGMHTEEIKNKIDKACAIHFFMGSWHSQTE